MDLEIEALNLVAKLNSEYFDRIPEPEPGCVVTPLMFWSTGDAFGINLMDIPIWDSENDDRGFATGEIKEPLELYVRRAVQEIATALNAFDWTKP